MFVAKNTDNFSHSVVEITQKVLNFKVGSVNQQSMSGKRFHSESTAMKYQLETLLEIVKTHVIDIEGVFKSYLYNNI